MNTKIKNTLITIGTSLIALLIVTTATYAIGTLTPSGTPGDDTQYSLNDIYDKLTDFTDNATATSSPFTVPGTISASFNTLSEIYGLLEAEEGDLVAANIADGVEIFGVTGTLEGATTLEWSTNQGALDWNAASTACAALTEGGASAGDWRLPTISELMAGISDDWIVEADSEGDRFWETTVYWSGTEFDGTNAWNALWLGYVSNGYGGGKATEFSVRCVR